MHQSVVRARSSRIATFFRAQLLLSVVLLWPALAFAQASPYCPTQTLSVANGGSVTSVDMGTCDGPFNFGMGGPFAPFLPTNGSVLLGPQSGPGNQTVTYTHNGSSTTTDTFALEDENGDELTFNVTIAPPASAIVVSPAFLPTLTAGTTFSQTLTSIGGVAPYTYSLGSGTLPVGVTLSAAGVVSGTPTQRGGYAFGVRSQDSIGAFVIKGYTGTVQSPSLTLVPATVTAIQGVAFSQALSTSGGVAPHSYLLETGTFPAGISISSAGVVSGTTAAAPGNYPVTLRVTDASTGPGSYFELEPFTLTVSPPPSVSIAVAPASVSEDGFTILVYTVTRSLNLSSPTVVNITTGGTATSGTDYTGGVATVSIPAGATTATITINPTADATAEANETAILTVAAGAGYTVGAPASATGTILNDDVSTATIAVAPASVSEDGAANLVYTVTLSAPPLVATSVNFTVGGTATSGTDFAAVTSPLTIAAGVTTGTVVVNPTADATIEANETAILTLAAGTGYNVGAPASATGTILNDDLPTLTINDVTLAEGNAGTSNATFTVSLSAPAGPGGVTFDLASANGTATAGVDYVANTLTGQTIAAGASTYTFTVLVNGDTLNEPTETFFVNVTNVANAVVGDGQGLGTLVNDDPLPSLSINDVTVTEGNTGTVNAVFTVSLSAASGQMVTVNYATADGIAVAPGDYTAASGTLSFTPGQITNTATVVVNGDIVPEANEAFSVGLFGATNSTIADGTGVGTISNDDVPVTINPATLPNGTVATAYSQTLTASGGIAPYAFSITAGALPPGLTLSAAGTLSGTPTAGGSFNFTVTGTDSSPFPGPFAGSRAYTVVIAAPTISLPATTLAGGTLGSAYSASITPASGGTSPYAYAVTAGALPGGLTLNAATGAITGTPGALGTFSFSITATDSSTGTGPYTATQSYSIVVINNPPVANASSLTLAYNAAATNVPLNITGGAATSVAIGTAAGNGSAIATGTAITYQPATGFAGTDSFTYTAINSGGTSAPATVTVTVSNPVITITASGGFAATVGAPYIQTFSWNGGAPPWSSYQVTNLPAGVSITGTTANSVTVAGTPTQAGSFSLNVSATDSSTGNGPFSVGQAFTLTVAGPGLSLAPAGATFNAPYGAAYSQAFTASGGIGPYTYASVGVLPPGLDFSGGTISGTATLPGSYSFALTATDTGSTGAGGPFTVTRNYTINVAAPTIIIVDPASMPNGTAGQPYPAITYSATGGVGPYTFRIISGQLPLSIAGTPYQVGNFPITVEARDVNGQRGTRNYTFTIAPPLLTLSPAAGTLVAPYGQAYNQSFVGGGNVAPMTYAITGALPAGLTGFNGNITGTPTAPGNYAISVTARENFIQGPDAPYTITQNYTISVPAPTIVVTPATLPNPTAGTPYSQKLTATGGVGPHGFAITAGTLPTSINLMGDGTLSGTSNQVGTFNFTVTATDANGQTGSRAYTLTIAAPTLTLAPAAGTLSAPYGVAYSQAFTAGGSAGPFNYVLSGALPTGVTFSGNTLSGTPTVPGNYPFTVTATDTALTGVGAPFSITRNYTLNVPAPSIVVNPATLPNPTAGTAYSQAISASGGVGLYAFSVTTGTLPTGITLVTSGTLSGLSNQVGTFNFTVTATDANGQTGSRAYTLTIAAPTLTLAPAAGTLSAPYGVAYSQAFTAGGSAGPFNYVLSGALPTGVTFSGNTLSGTPTVPGNYPFTVTATDTALTGVGAPFSITRNYTLNVPAPSIVVNPATLGNGTASQPYSATLSATGGVGSYGFTVTAGALPAGLTLTSAGTLSGTPTVSGTFNFTVTATDANGQVGTRAYTLVVAAPALTLTPATLPQGIVGVAYSQVFSTTGGIAPYSYAVTAGTLPGGLTLTAGGTLAGTPTAAGSFTFTVRSTDSTGGTAATVSQAYTLVVINAPPVAVNDTATVLAGQAVTIAVTSNDVTLVPITSIAIATAPTQGTAVVSGLNIIYTAPATASPTVTFTYVAIGPGGTSAPATVTVTVNPLPVAPALTATTTPATPVQVTLTAGASGGPFTGATVVAVSPAGAGITSIAASGTNYVLTFTPAASFNGVAVVRYTLRNAFATSAEGTVTITVLPRPDPSLDAEVRGLVDAQVESTKRFATTQINNFQQRLERLHSGGEGGFDNRIGFAIDRPCIEPLVGYSIDPCNPDTHGFRGGNGLDNRASGTGAGSGSGNDGPVGTWLGGMIRSGSQDGRNGGADIDFETDGLSTGIDYRLSEELVIGGGFGYGQDENAIGNDGSRVDGSARTVAFYASYHPGRLFVDTLLGYQSLDYDLRRYITANGGTVNGQRDGSQKFASVSVGADIVRDNMLVTPYARLDVAQARLDAYTETGDPIYSLAFEEMDVDSTTGNLGLRVDWQHEQPWGRFTPQVRLEYQHDFSGRSGAVIRYADLIGGPVYGLSSTGFDNNRFMVGLGALFDLKSGWGWRLEYRGQVGSSGESDNGVSVNVQKQF